MTWLLALGALANAATGSVCVEVVTGDGRATAPVAGVALRLDEWPYSAVADADGRARIDGVPVGAHALVVVAPIPAMCAADVPQFHPQALTVDVAADTCTAVRVALAPAPREGGTCGGFLSPARPTTLTVHVVDAHGEPFPAATVTVDGLTALTDGAGEVVLASSAGLLAVRGSAGDSCEAAEASTILDGQPNALTLHLPCRAPRPPR